MDNQRPDVVPNVQDDMPAGRPLNVSRHHARLSLQAAGGSGSSSVACRLSPEKRGSYALGTL
jgi:hypothetical protein